MKKRLFVLLVIFFSLSFVSARVSHSASEIDLPGGSTLAQQVPAGATICTSVNSLSPTSQCYDDVGGGGGSLWTEYGANGVYFDRSGDVERVGIGTYQPEGKFVVVHDSTGSFNDHYGFRYQSAIDGWKQLLSFSVDGSNHHSMIHSVLIDPSGSPTATDLYINPLGGNVLFNKDGGNVGIGISSLTQKLNVGGGIRVKGRGSDVNPTPSNDFGIRFSDNNGNPEDGDDTAITSRGNGIIDFWTNGMPGPTMSLQTGRLILSVGAQGAVTGNSLCVGAGGIVGVCGSSRALKTNIKNLNFGLETIGKLKPVTFGWKGSSQQSLGFIAEEVEAINPILSTYDSEGKLVGVKYPEMTALLTKGMQEQQDQINQLRIQNLVQQRKIDELTRIACKENPKLNFC
ncbi:MAG: tail fiber domain-containing protein [archaeon]